MTNEQLEEMLETVQQVRTALVCADELANVAEQCAETHHSCHDGVHWDQAEAVEDAVKLYRAARLT